MGATAQPWWGQIAENARAVVSPVRVTIPCAPPGRPTATEDPTGTADSSVSDPSVFVDGAKGPGLSYRAWDGQLRQPVFLAHGDGVIGTAPLEGVLHPIEQLDTLGIDRQESACRATS